MHKLLKPIFFFFPLLALLQLHGMARKRKKVSKVTTKSHKKQRVEPGNDFQLSQSLQNLKTNIDFLPPEILQEIMKYASKDSDPYKTLQQLGVFKYVSKMWKNNALYLQDKFLEQAKEQFHLRIQPTFSCIPIKDLLIKKLTLSPNGNYLVGYKIKKRPKTILILDLQNKDTTEPKFLIHTKNIDHVCFYSNILLTTSDNEISFWNLKEAQPYKIITHPHKITALACSPNNRFLAIGADGEITIYYLKSKTSTTQPTKHKDSQIVALKFAPDNSFLISIGMDNFIIHMFDPEKQTWIDNIKSVPSGCIIPSKVYISPDSQSIFLRFFEGPGLIFTKEESFLKKHETSHIQGLYCCGFTKNNNTIWNSILSLAIAQNAHSAQSTKVRHFFRVPFNSKVFIVNHKIFILLLKKKKRETIFYIPKVKTPEQIKFCITCDKAFNLKNIEKLKKLLEELFENAHLQFDDFNVEIMKNYIASSIQQINEKKEKRYEFDTFFNPY